MQTTSQKTNCNCIINEAGKENGKSRHKRVKTERKTGTLRARANQTGKTQRRNTMRQENNGITEVVRVEDLNSPPVMEQVLLPVAAQLAGQLLEQHGILVSPWPLKGRLFRA